MGCEQLLSNMRSILKCEDLKRIECKEVIDGLACVVLDLHGLSYKNAVKMIKNVISVNRGAFVINAIHGYSHGTILKEMINNELLSYRISKRYTPAWNPGQTYLKIAA